jgi:hypothetical protein
LQVITFQILRGEYIGLLHWQSLSVLCRKAPARLPRRLVGERDFVARLTRNFFEFVAQSPFNFRTYCGDTDVLAVEPSELRSPEHLNDRRSYGGCTVSGMRSPSSHDWASRGAPFLISKTRRASQRRNPLKNRPATV